METIKNSKLGIFPPPFTPYDYQTPIIKKMIGQVLAGLNGLVIQPTATGKSVQAAFTARALILLHNMRGLYVYDENEGLDQARKRFDHIFGKNGIICANFFGYGKDPNVSNAQMVFASFQSLNNHHKKWYTTFDRKHFNFMIVNEAHHGQAASYKEVIDYFACPKSGMTATPKRMDEKDILDIFENIIHEMLLEEAMAKGWVVPVEYHIMSHGLSTQKLKKICSEVLEEGKRISIKQLNENIFIEALDAETRTEIYKYAFPEDESARQTIIFCENIVHAEHVFEEIAKDGMAVARIHSGKTKHQNQIAMQDFRDEKIQFLIAVDKLNEDIDVPNVKLGVFLRATNSLTVWLQQMGRLLRKKVGKEKAIILDFVANCERLIMVQELINRVVKFAEKEKNQIPLEKTLLRVSGKGFNFAFSDEVTDLVKILEVIQKGFYSTWQEASSICISSHIKSGDDYRLRYTKIDFRLPSNPNQVYSDFPGWNVFLGKLPPPEGWKTVNQLCEKLSSGSPTIKNFVQQFRTEHPTWFVKYCNFYGTILEHYHPELVTIVMNKLGEIRTPPPEGWTSSVQLVEEAKIAEYVISSVGMKNFVEHFRKDHKEWFGSFWRHNALVEHYHPDLVQFIRDFINKRLLAPDGWRTISSFFDNSKSMRLAAMVRFVNQFRAEHPDWFQKFCVVNGNFVEHFHPVLVEKIRNEFPEEELQGKWIAHDSFAKQQKVSRKRLSNLIEPFCTEHPEWVKVRELGPDRQLIIYHPSLVEMVATEIKLENEEKEQGWITVADLAHEKVASWSSIQSYVAKAVKKHPEWIKERGGITYLHPKLAGKIRKNFSRPNFAPDGWTTFKQITDLFGWRGSISKIIELHRKTNPEWFQKFQVKNGRVHEHCHPDLVEKIKVHFKNKK